MYPLTIFTYFIVDHEETASSLCAILICALSLFSTIQSLYSFIIYLILDTFFRKTEMDFEIKCHHSVSGLLTLLGIIGISMNNEYSVIATKIAGFFITMEITTPLIHSVKYFKQNHLNFQTYLCSLCILVLWLPFRIIRPFKALYLIFGILQVHFIYVPIFISGLLLSLLQIYWYVRLCVLAIKLLMN